MSQFVERYQRVTDSESILVFLEIYAASFQERLRIVNDTRNWTSNGVEYIGAPFGFKRPDDVSGQSSRVVLTIDNVGRAITEDLEGLTPGDIVRAKIMISSTADPDFIETSMVVPLTQVSVNMRTATANAGWDAVGRQQAVRLRYNPFTSPGIF